MADQTRQYPAPVGLRQPMEQRPVDPGAVAPLYGTVTEQRTTAAMRKERDVALAEVARLRQMIAQHRSAVEGRNVADDKLWNA